MTPENYAYRNSLFFLRNDFIGNNKWHIPDVPKFEIKEGDFDDLRMIGFDKAKTDETHFHRIVHFYLYDYKFESVWKKPSDYTEKLNKFKAILTPDFSMYLEMHPLEKLHNVFRNRWIGAYYASKGLRVIPSVSWGDEDTFDYCFEGITKNSVVSVSTYMVSEHGRTPAQKDFFLKGYNELLRRIEPECILCYSDPFPEMEGNIITVDYEQSSWKHMNEDAKKSSCMFQNPRYDDIIKPKFLYIVYAKGIGSSRAGHPCIIFREQRIFIHDELFDLDFVDREGRTNRERMLEGKAPIGIDGNSVQLHHINQDPDGDLEEILQTVHQRNTKELHPYRNRPSKINRNKFGNYRSGYWTYRITRYVEDKE